MSEFEDQIRECYGRVIYTHKTHMKMADGCSAKLNKLKWVQIVLSALTASGVVSILLFDQYWIKVATALISFSTLYASSYIKGFDPGGMAQKHADAAARLWSVRESYLSLIVDARSGSVPDDELREKRDSLQAELATIYASAPQTNGKAYAAAQQALQKDEEYTFSDKELDKFLPEPLRKTKVQAR